MTGTKHTPGPWHPGHLGSDSTCQCKSVVDEGDAGGICTVHVDNGLLVGEGGNDSPPREEAIANMHLIAAAPDLLDALKSLFKAGQKQGWDHHYEHEMEATRKAIAKAEGQP